MPRTFSDELTGTSVPVGQLLELREGKTTFITLNMTSTIKQRLICSPLLHLGLFQPLVVMRELLEHQIQVDSLLRTRDWQTQVCLELKVAEPLRNEELVSMAMLLASVLNIGLMEIVFLAAGLPGSNRCLGLCVSGMSNSNTATGTFHTAGRILFARRTVVIYSKS